LRLAKGAAHAYRRPVERLLGWVELDRFYAAAINEGETLADADWLSQHLNSFRLQLFPNR
jgi:hypothetical protein